MMANIKIFVSHRIDKDAEIIDNPLYVPVRCGAVFDECKSAKLQGDNTGINISEKRMSFCELTVLYWAWKNQKADYYGLCHYRRYLSFNDNPQDFSTTEHNQGCIAIQNLNQETIEKYNLTKSIMSKEIEKYDAIFMTPIDLKKLNIKSNYEAMKSSPDYHNIKDVDIMMNIVKEKYPDMYETACEYMYKAKHSFLYNCFIMKADIFNNFCQWFFDILFDLEQQIDMTKYTQQQYRAIGTIGERLLGIYELWLQKQKKYNIKHTPLLFVENTDVNKPILPAFPQNNIAIVSNFNDKYAPIFSTFLTSAIAHSSKTANYDFIILSDDISEDHKRMLSNMLKSNMSIRYLSPKQYLSDTHLIIRHNVYTPDLYYRIIIPQILTEYDKLLVVDADMICREDIANVFNEDISNYLAGACIDSVLQGYLNGADPAFKPYAINYMKMKDPYKYVNTGLLLFNAKRYRAMYSLSFLKEFINKHIANVKIYEQDMLNMLLDTKIKFLNSKWNCYTKSNDFIKKCFSLCPFETYKEYEKARKSNAGIIHYAAHPKPWWEATVDLSDIWWEYARKTPFYEEILSRMVNFQTANKEQDSKQTQLLYVASNINSFRLKKLIYKLKKTFSSGKRQAKYKNKYNQIKHLLKEAKNFKKQMLKI